MLATKDRDTKDRDTVDLAKLLGLTPTPATSHPGGSYVRPVRPRRFPLCYAATYTLCPSASLLLCVKTRSPLPANR